jgi:type VI protein secretion system component VasF
MEYSVKALMVMHQIFNLGNTDRYRVAELGDKAN